MLRPDLINQERILSPNFSALENMCKCGECNRYSADIELLQIMQFELRNYYERPVKVNSWFRCRAHNNRPKDEMNRFGVYGAGSNDHSFHLIGAAIDFTVRGIEPIEVYERLDNKYPRKFGIGLYERFVHFDIRPLKARWKLV